MAADLENPATHCERCHKPLNAEGDKSSDRHLVNDQFVCRDCCALIYREERVAAGLEEA